MLGAGAPAARAREPSEDAELRQLAEEDEAARLLAPVEAEVDAERAHLQLIELREAHRRARSLFGENRIGLFPMATASCADWSVPAVGGCSGNIEWRAVGAVGLRILGYAPGRPLTFMPSVETAAEAAAYSSFERHAHRLGKAMAHHDLEPDTDSPESIRARERRYEAAHEALFEIVLRDVMEKGERREESEAFLGCLKALHGSVEPVSSKLAQLNRLWDEYNLLYGEENYRGRYNFLLEPVLGTPLDGEIGKTLIYGIAVELSWRFWDTGFGLTVGGGWRSDSRDPFSTTGSWLGLGLTGELGANLIDRLSGAAAWGEQL